MQQWTSADLLSILDKPGLKQSLDDWKLPTLRFALIDR